MRSGIALVRIATRLAATIPTLLFPIAHAHFGDGPHPVAPAEILTWNDEQRSVGFRSYADIFPTRTIRAGEITSPLVENHQDLSGVSYSWEGKTFTLDDYLQANRVAGIIVVQGGRVRFERYRLDSGPSTVWVSYSIAKSVVSMLFGAAIADGYIEGVKDPITRYLPRLAGGAYEGVSVEQLLQMSSGVTWQEDYVDPQADVSRLPSRILPLIDYMQALPRAAKPGTKFNYSTGETHLAGAVLRAAIGNNLADYLTHKIWQPFGMEADGNWMLGTTGGAEHAGCCISATLRDYARLGLFAMGGGVAADGSRILPPDWMAASTSPSPNFPGYGYFWWLREGGAFAAVGIYGQLIWVDPNNEIVIAMQSAWPSAGCRALAGQRWAVVDAIATAVNAEN